MALLSRDEIADEIYNKFMAKQPTYWAAADCKSDVELLGAYAILSHRWMDHELSMSDLQEIASTGRLASPDKALAYTKITTFCAKAKEYECSYVWFDSGCIDQRNPAELNESIPAMFKWYQNAAVCIVRLAQAHIGSNMADDEWFIRGWTLQELIAPSRMKFYDVDWLPITTDSYDITRESDWTVQGNIAHTLASVLKRPGGVVSKVTPDILKATSTSPWPSSRLSETS